MADLSPAAPDLGSPSPSPSSFSSPQLPAEPNFASSSPFQAQNPSPPSDGPVFRPPSPLLNSCLPKDSDAALLIGLREGPSGWRIDSCSKNSSSNLTGNDLQPADPKQELPAEKSVPMSAEKTPDRSFDNGTQQVDFLKHARPRIDLQEPPEMEPEAEMDIDNAAGHASSVTNENQQPAHVSFSKGSLSSIPEGCASNSASDLNSPELEEKDGLEKSSPEKPKSANGSKNLVFEIKRESVSGLPFEPSKTVGDKIEKSSATVIPWLHCKAEEFVPKKQKVSPHHSLQENRYEQHRNSPFQQYEQPDSRKHQLSKLSSGHPEQHMEFRKHDSDYFQQQKHAEGPILNAVPLSPLQKLGSSALPVATVCHPQIYPLPLATHEEVIRNPELFRDTLIKFHASLWGKFTIPRIGGKQLDLYLLYRSVTDRGGLQQVIEDGRWSKIEKLFSFSPSTTKRSLVLQKYYISLLYHYEQAYFFRIKGPLVFPPALLPSPIPERSTEVACEPEEQFSGGKRKATDSPTGGLKEPTPRKQRMDIPSVEEDPTAVIGHTVTGAIEEKIEHGYLVTVMLGSEKLRGILYSVPPSSDVPQFVSVPALASATSTSLMYAEQEGGLSMKRPKRPKSSRKDPNAPKYNRSAYNFFFAEQHSRLRVLHPNKDRGISRMIGDLWSNLTEEQKLPYQERGMKDKERYKKEIREYKEKKILNTNQSVVKEIEHHSRVETHGNHLDINKTYQLPVESQVVPQVCERKMTADHVGSSKPNQTDTDDSDSDVDGSNSEFYVSFNKPNTATVPFKVKQQEGRTEGMEPSLSVCQLGAYG